LNELFNLNPKVSTALSALIGYFLIDGFTANEQNVIGNWLMLTAQTLITNSASQSLIENRARGTVMNINSTKVKKCYNPFIYDIEELKKVINTIQPGVLSSITKDIHTRINNFNNFINNMDNLN
jgi:hypothetical protein